MDNAAQTYNDKARGILRAEIKRRNMSYDALAAKLAEIGVVETPKNLSNKIARGAFTAGFFIMCLEVIGVSTIRIEDA